MTLKHTLEQFDKEFDGLITDMPKLCGYIKDFISDALKRQDLESQIEAHKQYILPDVAHDIKAQRRVERLEKELDRYNTGVE